MKDYNSQKPIQPKVLDDDSQLYEYCNTMMSNNDGQCRNTMGPDRYSLMGSMVQINGLNNSNFIETPKSNSVISQINDEDMPPNELSYVFQKSNNKNIDSGGDTEVNENKLEGNEPVKITNLKDLLRLFRVNLKRDSTFQHQGQKYVLEFNRTEPVSPRDKLFKMKIKSMESEVSPMNVFSSRGRDQEEDKMNLDTPQFDNFTHYEHSPMLRDSKQTLKEMPQQQYLMNHPLFQRVDREVQVDLTKEIEQTTQIIKQDTQVQQDSPTFSRDTFYSDIANQIAQQIERESSIIRQDSIVPNQRIEHILGGVQHNKNKSEQNPGVMRSAEFRSFKVPSSSDMDLDLSGVQGLRRCMSYGAAKLIKKYNPDSQLNQENSVLQQQLNEALQQLENINSMFINQNNVADAKLHFVFLFASPLVLKQNADQQGIKNEFKAKPLLEFQKEFKEIKSSIRETRKIVRLKSVQATIENLTITLGQGPMAFHFSGHGILNNEVNFGRSHKMRKNEGNYLLFETQEGEGELVSEKTLRELITNSNTNLEFVFVASCYSQFAGEIFLNAGAKHVICIRSEQQVMDLSVINFSKSFYHSVFSTHMTICAAFEVAKKQVEVKFGVGEANKFILLKQNKPDRKSTLSGKMPPGLEDFDFDDLLMGGTGETKTEHKCKIFGPLKDGDAEILDKQPLFKEFPSKVDDFIGRQKEIFEVVQNAYQNRLVNVIGFPGIGKTSLAKNAVHYIADRRLFKAGVIFLPLKGYTTCELFVKKLLYKIIVQTFNFDKEEQIEIKGLNSEELLIMALQYLKSQEDEVLVVLDNVEDLLYYDKKAFRNLVNDVLTQCPNIHLLLTSRAILGALQDVSEKILVLKELLPKFTVQLFFSRSRNISDQEKLEFIDCQTIGESPITRVPSKQHKQKVTIQDHNFFQLLGGNPHATVLAAPLLMKMSLKELYLLLNSKEMHDVLKVDGISDSTVASIRLSLEASIKILQKEDTESLKFFFFLGLLPGGVYEDQLTLLWGEGWEKLMLNLFNFSLIQKRDQEDGEGEGVKYTLPPFMSNYAEAKITEEDKIVFQNYICHYYANLCKQILDRNGKSTVKSEANRTSELHHQLIENLLKHETNIWACIQRMVDQPLGEDSDVDSLGADENEEEEEEGLEQQPSIVFSQVAMPQHGFKRFSTLLPSSFKGVHHTSSLVQGLDINDLGQTSPTKIKEPSQQEIGLQNNLQSSNNAQNEDNLFGVRQKMKRNSVSIELNQSNSLFMNPIGKKEKSQKIGDQSQLSRQHGFIHTLELQRSSHSSSCESSVDCEAEHDGEEQTALLTFGGKKTLAPQNNGNELMPERKVSKSIVPLPSPRLEEEEKEKEEKLDFIIRNSIVNFQRPSGKIFLKQIKNFETSTQSQLFQRRSTMYQQDMKSMNKLYYKQSSSGSGNSTKKKIEYLHAAEQMIIYYALNLFLLRENDNALHLIQECALKVKGSTLYEANLKRIEGMVWYNKSQTDTTYIQNAIECFKKSKKLYNQTNSIYGEALSNFSIGFTYKSRIAQLQISSNEDIVYKKALKRYEKSNFLFKQINHVVGNALCNKELSLIHNKFNEKILSKSNSKEYLRLMQTFMKFKAKKSCPHIQRVHGPEISLMSELVMNNDNKKLFTEDIEKRKVISKTASSTHVNKTADEKPFKDIHLEIHHQTSMDATDHTNDLKIDEMLAQPDTDMFNESPERNGFSESVRQRDSFGQGSPATQNCKGQPFQPSPANSPPIVQKMGRAMAQKVNKVLEIVNEDFDNENVEADFDDDVLKLKQSISVIEYQSRNGTEEDKGEDCS